VLGVKEVKAINSRFAGVRKVNSTPPSLLCNRNTLADGKPQQSAASLTPSLTSIGIERSSCNAHQKPTERLPLIWEGCGLFSVPDEQAAALKGCQQEERLKQSGHGCEISVNSALRKSPPTEGVSGNLGCHKKILRSDGAS